MCSNESAKASRALLLQYIVSSCLFLLAWLMVETAFMTSSLGHKNSGSLSVSLPYHDWHGMERRRTNSHTIWRKASARKRDLTISSKKNHERGGDVGKEVTIFSTIFTKRKRVVVCSKEKSYLKCQTAIIQHVLKAEKGSG